MDVHKNARLTVHSRADLVARTMVGRQPVRQAANAFGIRIKTALKWAAGLCASCEAVLMIRP